jgi:uncharacterized protein
MMNRPHTGVRFPLSLLASGALAACGSSAPIRYYTLQRIDPASRIDTAQVPDSGRQSGAAMVVRLEPVAIPAELDRPELVTHTGPYRVRIADSERWAAPLEEQIRRVLSDDLAERLPAHWIADPLEAAGGDPRRLLSIAIAEFNADESCAVTLRAEWSLRGPGAGSNRGTEQIQMPANGSCQGTVAAAMSSALGQLADRLAPAILACDGDACSR